MSHSSTGKSRLLGTTTILLSVLVLTAITGWAFVVVKGTTTIPSSEFASLPTTAISTQGTMTAFENVTAMFQSGLAVGVLGYLLTSSGVPVAGAKVYMTYFYDFAYRTQVTTTNHNGSFEALLPMNWTGWLPLTLTYSGDGQLRGLRQVFSVRGEHL